MLMPIVERAGDAIMRVYDAGFTVQRKDDNSPLTQFPQGYQCQCGDENQRSGYRDYIAGIGQGSERDQRKNQQGQPSEQKDYTINSSLIAPGHK